MTGMSLPSTSVQLLVAASRPISSQRGRNCCAIPSRYWVRKPVRASDLRQSGQQYNINRENCLPGPKFAR
jgi:hypothetical protein